MARRLEFRRPATRRPATRRQELPELRFGDVLQQLSHLDEEAAHDVEVVARRLLVTARDRSAPTRRRRSS